MGLSGKSFFNRIFDNGLECIAEFLQVINSKLGIAFISLIFSLRLPAHAQAYDVLRALRRLYARCFFHNNIRIHHHQATVCIIDKPSFPVFFIRPGIVFDVNPTFRTVSIMPGIELLAPDRTDTRSGFSGFPNFLPMIFSTFASAASDLRL